MQANDAATSLFYASQFQSTLPQLRPNAKRSADECLHNPLRELQRRLHVRRGNEQEYRLPLCKGVPSTIPPKPPSLATIAPTYESYEDEVLSFWGVWYVLCAAVRFLRPIARKRMFREHQLQQKLHLTLFGHAAEQKRIQQQQLAQDPTQSQSEDEPLAAVVHNASKTVVVYNHNPVRAAHKALRSSLATSSLRLRQGQCSTLRAARSQAVVPSERVSTAPHRPTPLRLQLRPAYAPSTATPFTPRPPTHGQVAHSYRPPTSNTLVGATCRQRNDLGYHLFKQAEVVEPCGDPELPDEQPAPHSPSSSMSDSSTDNPFHSVSFPDRSITLTTLTTAVRRRWDGHTLKTVYSSDERPFNILEEELDPTTRVPLAIGETPPIDIPKGIDEDACRWTKAGMASCDTSVPISVMHHRREAARKAVHERGAQRFAKERDMRDAHRGLRRKLLLERLDTPLSGGRARRQDLEGMLKATQAELQKSDTRLSLQRIVEARSAWYSNVYQQCTERFPFESVRRVLYLLHCQLEEAGGSHGLGLPELVRLAACLSDDEISDVATQFCLLQVCIAFDQSYVAFRELLEVRHAPYRLKGNGSSFAK